MSGMIDSSSVCEPGKSQARTGRGVTIAAALDAVIPASHRLWLRALGANMKCTSSSSALLLVFALTTCGGCLAYPGITQATQTAQSTSAARHLVGGSAHTVPGLVPDESAVKALTGDATSGLLSVVADRPDAPVSDRILNGFQAGVTGLDDGFGRLITWGFKYKEASFQSVAIHDASGRLLLVAAVYGMHVLDNGSEAAYREMLQRAGSPSVRVFSRNRSDLALGYPLLKRWLEAGLVGFNANCAKTAAICMLAEQISLPAKAYVISPDGSNLAEVPVPSVAAASIPLDAFRQ